MRLGEVPFALDIEQVLDSVEVEKERIAAAAGEKSVRARLDDIRLGAEGDLGVSDDLRPCRFGRARLRACRHEYVDGLPAVLWLREYVAECDVRQVIAVGIDVEAIDCVRMKRVRIGICIEDDHGSVLVSGRLECVEVAEVESLIAQRGAETQSSEMVRHWPLLLNQISILGLPDHGFNPRSRRIVTGVTGSNEVRDHRLLDGGALGAALADRTCRLALRCRATCRPISRAYRKMECAALRPRLAGHVRRPCARFLNRRGLLVPPCLRQRTVLLCRPRSSGLRGGSRWATG